MNPEILERIKAFEREGISLQRQLAFSVTQASSRKDFGNMLTNLFAGEVLPYGTIGIGKQFARGALSNHQKIAQHVEISILTRSVTTRGNSGTLIKKFNSAKNVTSAQTKISRGLKAIKQLQTCELVYNRDLDKIIKEKKLQSANISKYKEMVSEAKNLLKNYPSYVSERDA